MTALQPIFEFILTRIMAIVNGVINAAAPIIAAITNVVEFITNIISAFFALFSGDTDAFLEYIKAAFRNAIDFLKNIISARVNFIVGYFEGFGQCVLDIRPPGGKPLSDRLKCVRDVRVRILEHCLKPCRDCCQCVLDIRPTCPEPLSDSLKYVHDVVICVLEHRQEPRSHG